MELPNSYWDKLASRYPRYTDESIQSDARFIFGVAEDFGVDFEGKNILDIGCGTGTLAIPLASRASKITALDLSKPMLDIFEYDKETLNLEDKIDIFHTSWDDFIIKDKYDISLASMTPAVSSQEQISKFINSTLTYGIFVGWGDFKNNDIIDELLKKHNTLKNKTFGQTQRFTDYLKAVNIKHDVKYFQTSWSDSYIFEDALDYAISHLERFGVEPDVKVVENILLAKIKDNKIKFTTNAQKGVVVFKI
ncbi:methyltransferase domain-containing protein [Arcobacter sp. FWKO B]|uniref:methyltransferase domain-containing protein n=1 Tax=Arcobacter sp. FWKO B TaxID=2593672 RepID=UPI001906A255|nr:methyltransferase domain-containing protein [Arcobacter sp. FWKO B]